MNKIVLYRVNLHALPPLTEERKLELKALSEMPDSEIDYSDITLLDESFWKNARRHRFQNPVRTHALDRMDDDLVES
jgi:uncharacterized protein (DUF4415 family)